MVEFGILFAWLFSFVLFVETIWMQIMGQLEARKEASMVLLTCLIVILVTLWPAVWGG